jgi:ABC-type glycerol-3-phosphate transport system substrate-binding protein
MRHIFLVPKVTAISMLAMVLVASSATAQEATAGDTEDTATAFAEPPPEADSVEDMAPDFPARTSETRWEPLG